MNRNLAGVSAGGEKLARVLWVQERSRRNLPRPHETVPFQ